MCFSEKVSFATSAALTVVTFGCIWSVRGRKELYALAAIPLFFALQQAAEGVQWLVFKELWGSAKEAKSAKDLYIFIAFVVWPFWIPFSVWVAEKEGQRKRYLEILLMIGFFVAIFDAWKILFFPVAASAAQSSIQYEVEIPRIMFWPYVIAVTLPWFVSSLPRTTILGIVFTIGVALAGYFYYDQFISVWCFFAGLVSLLLLWALNASSE